MNIISFVGFANSGKSTAANILVKHGFTSMSFADGIKDCLSAIFCWPRDLLEGTTKESRIFRETVDEWWAKKLNIKNFTPRYAMKNFGTETMRHHFHDDIWVMNVECRLSQIENQSVVFGDVRHPNEMILTKQLGGKLIRIKKGNDPEWFDTAKKANEGDNVSLNLINNTYKIHNSEMAWIGKPLDATIINDESIKKLEEKIINLL